MVAMSLRRKYTPVLAIVGFLGSGKTTLLNHILKENKGLKIGVIVNDFGDINIDSMLVARQTDQQLELSNGCICCSLEGNSLDEAIGQLAHAGSTIDYIIIEASGLAEPAELLRLLVNSKNPHARFDSLIAVVDAENVLDTHQKHPTFIEQLKDADILILNKTDLVNAKKLKKVKGYLEFVNQKAHVIDAINGAIDTRLLLSPDHTVKDNTQLVLSEPEEDHSMHLHHTYQRMSYTQDKPLDPQLWEQFVELLPPSIYRAKGFIYFGMKGLEQKFLFQSVGKRHEMKLDEWLGTTPKTELVFIGQGIDESALQSALDELVDTAPDNLSNGTIMDVLSYK
jgi:cobalamin biosynthesis protein CobW